VERQKGNGDRSTCERVENKDAATTRISGQHLYLENPAHFTGLFRYVSSGMDLPDLIDTWMAPFRLPGDRTPVAGRRDHIAHHDRVFHSVPSALPGDGDRRGPCGNSRDHRLSKTTAASPKALFSCEPPLAIIDEWMAFLAGVSKHGRIMKSDDESPQNPHSCADTSPSMQRGRKISVCFGTRGG
jgi:hypothetical protein